VTPGKTIAVIQARMRSERLPGKVMREIGGHPALRMVLTRARRAETFDDVWVACSTVVDDDAIAEYAQSCGVSVFRGDEDDVLSRFVEIARRTDAAVIARITADCPFIDPEVADKVVRRFHEGGADFVSNTLQRSYPDGLDVEVFSRAALERTDREAKLPFLRGHVTPYMHGRLRDRLPWGEFKIAQVVNEVDFSHLRWTLDEAEDLDFFRRVVPQLPEDFEWLDVVALLCRVPNLLRINNSHRPYEGSERDLDKLAVKRNSRRSFAKSNEFFLRAQKTIPLASQTFSKSHLQWVRGATPLFAESARGCRFTDIDGNSYIDYVLALLPVVLGYRDPDVDAAIIEQLDRGIVFSLAHRLEAELAERLVRYIPCAELVRFGKNGSDATTAAIRLARAYTGRDKVAICGYHGWHDWYIGTTTRHIGVPAAVRDLSTTFPFNDADALEKLLRAEPTAYAAVIMEPAGARAPAPGFLERVRAITEKYGVVLIFDEIIAGFRINIGGAQAHYGVTPDLSSFGKSMANGMPISAVVGRAEIMRLMDKIFFSATFGGEALSLAAGVATIDKLVRENVPARLAARGAKLRDAANVVLERRGFGGVAQFEGDGWWPRLKLTNPACDVDILNSLFRQEFVENGLLIGASLNLCLAHDSDAVMNETITAFGDAVAQVRRAVDSGDPKASLLGEKVQPVFAVR